MSDPSDDYSVDDRNDDELELPLGPDPADEPWSEEPLDEDELGDIPSKMQIYIDYLGDPIRDVEMWPWCPKCRSKTYRFTVPDESGQFTCPKCGKQFWIDMEDT